LLGKNLRHTIKRLQNRLERERTPVRFEVLTEPERMERAVAEYSALERVGWKGREGTAVLGDDDQGRFYTAMLQEFCRERRGIVYQLHLDNRLVASDLCIHDGRTIIILKTAYDETAKAWSPAQLMRYLAFEKFFDEYKFGAIEFYGPVKDWHTKLTSDIRTMYHVNFYRAPIFADMHTLIRRRAPVSELATAD
jgi:CelD/BcsL family acetyltransferase involved in cellulose biosynthesis